MKKIVLIGFLSSFCIELIQYLAAIGLAELDDLVADTIGAIVGFKVWDIVRAKKRWRRNV